MTKLALCLSVLVLVEACFLDWRLEVTLTAPEEFKAQADEFFERGDYRKAASAYERLSKTAMQNEQMQAYARFRQGLARLKDGRKSEAFRVWEQMRLFHPASQYVPVVLLLEAENTTNPIRSEKLYDEILAKFPDSMAAATILIKRGQAACDGKDYRTAAKWWERLLANFPDTGFRAAVEPQLDREAEKPPQPSAEELRQAKSRAHQSEERARAERRARWQQEAREFAKRRKTRAAFRRVNR